MTSRNVSENIYFENSIVHRGISLTIQKPLTVAMINFVQKNGFLIFDFCLSRTLNFESYFYVFKK